MNEDNAKLEKLIGHVRHRPAALARLARTFMAQKQDALARDLCRQAVALAPDDEEVHALAASVFNAGVPDWHFSIVRDAARNHAYEAALRRAVTPGCRVLEVGTGTGLLAMMAARAGAGEVITCEMNPAIAEAAREVIARNGYSDRVRVVAKHSSDLVMGIDLPAPADVFVSEIISNDMVSEHALPAVEYTVRHLVKPGAAIVPARGTVRVALAQDTKSRRTVMGVVDGFDLSPFNVLAPQNSAIAAGQGRVSLRSEPGDLFDFDFQSGGPFPEARSEVTLVSKGGHVNGIAQWIRLDMDGVGRFENPPQTDAQSSWGLVFYSLKRPLETEAGTRIAVCGTHDRNNLCIWART